MEMSTSYYGKNVLVELQDAIYQTTKERDTDGDSNTKSTRMDSAQQLLARDLIKNNLRIDETKSTTIIKDLVAATNGSVTLLLNPNQFTALMLAIQAQSTKLLKLGTYNAQVLSTVVDLTSKATFR